MIKKASIPAGRLTPVQQDTALKDLIMECAELQDVSCLIWAFKCIRGSELSFFRDRLMPDYGRWLDSLPDEQITWLADDCIVYARMLAKTLYTRLNDELFIDLPVYIHAELIKLGTDKPRLLAEGILELLKTILPLFEASMLTFVLIQHKLPDQYPDFFFDD